MPRKPLPLNKIAWPLAVAVLCQSRALLAKPKAAGVTIRPICGVDGALKSIWVRDELIEVAEGAVDLAQIQAVIGKANPKVHLVSTTDVPYRCIGGLIFELQRAGVTNVGFLAERSRETEKP